MKIKDKLMRRFLSLLLKIPYLSKSARDFLLWPAANNLISRDYSEVISFNGIKMRVYADIPDMVCKELLFASNSNFPWEPKTSSLFFQLAEKSKTILIAGGHLGYYALLAGKANSESTIYVFEPTSMMFRRLKENIKLNGFDNIVVENKALSGTDGESEVVVDAGQSTLVKHAGNSLKSTEIVKTISIDSYFANLPNKPDLVLLDVEGYEPSVLSGAVNTIQYAKPSMIIEMNDKMLRRAGSSADKLQALIEKHHYSVNSIDSQEMEGCFNVLAKAM